MVAPRRYDVAIVGAGPAGAWAAHQLARAGAQVALLDGTHPREKPCGGGVTARALSVVGDPGGGPSTAIDSASFTYADRRAVVPLTNGHARPRLEVYARREFDARLLARARKAGAVAVTERVSQVERLSGAWHLTTRAGIVIAPWLIGADGVNSLVRRRVSVPFSRADLSIACGYYAHGASSRRIDVAFVARPSGYLWSFPRPDHLAVGVCAQADEASIATLMPIVDDWIRTNVRQGVRLERYSWPIPSLTSGALQREMPAGPGWLLLGDAAGLVDPITREGIYFALESAEHAAASLLAGSDPAAAYAERLRETVYAELLRAARLKARFYRPAFVNLLITALQKSERVGAVMADLVAGEQPYHSLRARLLKTCEFRLMWELVGLQRT